MSEDTSPELQLSFMSEERQAEFRAHRAEQEQKYNNVIAGLEEASLEPEQHAAYEATLPEMLALELPRFGGQI